MSGSIISQSPAFLAEDIGPSITATASLMIVFSTVFVGLRFYARFLAHAKFGVEDVITPFAWLGEMGICITGIGASVSSPYPSSRLIDCSDG